jgi:predicted DNA-binding transcriptional regulator YafY
MRRADRLINLIGHLRGGGVVTADELARRLEVSVRTVYRDVVTLQAQGLPIEGQSGLGYALRGAVDLPPLTFDHDEFDALALGLAYVVQVGDPALAAAARAARAKIDLAWNDQPIPAVTARPLRVHQMATQRAPAYAADLRMALRTRRQVAFDYCNAEGRASRRKVRPLALTAFSGGWLLVGWCTLRNDFRVFRLDRMSHPTTLDQTFSDEPERDLMTYLSTRVAMWARDNISPLP